VHHQHQPLAAGCKASARHGSVRFVGKTHALDAVWPRLRIAAGIGRLVTWHTLVAAAVEHEQVICNRINAKGYTVNALLLVTTAMSNVALFVKYAHASMRSSVDAVCASALARTGNAYCRRLYIDAHTLNQQTEYAFIAVPRITLFVVLLKMYPLS
jgi:hypothetical protein